MEAKVIGIFQNRSQAEQAITALRQKGFNKEISIIGKENTNNANKDTGNGRQDQQGYGANISMAMENTDSTVDGTATGGVIGGLAGLAAGAGALVVPGIGPLLAAGPLAGALTGAISGGIAGGLVDLGIPAEESKRYEGEIRKGHIMVGVDCNKEKASQARQILKDSGAMEVKEH